MLVGILSACTTNGKVSANLALQDAANNIVSSTQIAALATPYSYGYLTDKQAPLPSFKELAYSPADKNLAAFAVSRSGTASSSPIVLQQASPKVEKLISKYSLAYNVPERLVRRVVKRESNGNPVAKNGPYLGLMQITHPTAKGMGYAGEPRGLLDAETNLRYAVKYLAGAYKVSGGNEAQAVQLYARGYYYNAKAKGLLEETGLRAGAKSPETAFADGDDGVPEVKSSSRGNGTVERPINQ